MTFVTKPNFLQKRNVNQNTVLWKAQLPFKQFKDLKKRPNSAAFPNKAASALGSISRYDISGCVIKTTAHRLKEVIASFWLEIVTLHLDGCFQFWFPSIRQTLSVWRTPVEEKQEDYGDGTCHVWGEAGGTVYAARGKHS